MSGFAIRAEALSKKYRRGLHVQPYRTLRDALATIGRPRPRSSEEAWFWALRDVSFELREGETLGFVGPNGAGKTTLLKVLSRVTSPTAGFAEVNGRLGSLLEVGTGFHLELTGRENVKLNGAILGMSRQDIQQRFDEIVEFAGVEAFIDTPVKRYSSGMFMRLAFAVAAHLEPDILIVDEVLAVGDAQFQKKCLGKLDEVGSEGRTVIFVSHNLSAVEQICSRAILLDHGRVIEDGPTRQVLDDYMRRFAAAEAEVVFETPQNQPAGFSRLSTLAADGSPSTRFGVDEPIICEIEIDVREPIRGEHVWLRVYQASGLLLIFAADEELVEVPALRQPGRHVARFTIPPFVVNEGNYRFRAQLLHRVGMGDYVVMDDRRSGVFDVEDSIDYGGSELGKRKGVLRMPLTYEEYVKEPASHP
jgi:lipopolysaccharide transport system ATP-binding protein